MTTARPRTIATALLAILALVALAATIFTWSWSNVSVRHRAMTSGARKNGSAVDTRPLDAAQQLEQLAETRTEKAYAAEALRLADYSVDFAFAAAIREAASAPPLTDSTTREIATRLKQATDAVAADSTRIATLTPQVGRASGATHDNLQQQLDLAQAQLELDRDDVDDAQQDLVRAGGDRLASIQRLRAQHDTSFRATSTATTASAPTTPTPPSIEQTKSSSILDQAEAWFSLSAKRKLLDQARQSTVDRATAFAAAHDALEKQVVAEKAAQQILHAKGRNAGNVALARSAADAKRVAATVDSLPASAGRAASAAVPATALSFLQDLAADQKDLSELDKRIENEQDLAALYDNWIDYVHLRQQSFLHGIFLSAFWVLLIALLVGGANVGVQHVFAEVALQHRGLHTVRTLTLFGAQAGGILVILVVIFGMPNNFATVIALAGAGLALALQDFIVGFFGWFVLMGKDGIRPGDWVEINGVGGEVLEVGVFQTVLLETSNWSAAADPTGRKVSFVNSFAIEGHYFNFSTSGQWLWDELEVQVADGTDPYAIAEEMQRLATSETAPNADVAEQEWRRVVPAGVRQTFSAVPSVSVRPSGSGVSILVRYLTRASDRQEIRTRMYRAMIALLHGQGGATGDSVAAVTPPARQISS